VLFGKQCHIGCLEAEDLRTLVTSVEELLSDSHEKMLFDPQVCRSSAMAVACSLVQKIRTSLHFKQVWPSHLSAITGLDPKQAP
jgi:hypothetical protein